MLVAPRFEVKGAVAAKQFGRKTEFCRPGASSMDGMGISKLRTMPVKSALKFGCVYFAA
jgi:hypothetical protein